MQPPHRRRLCCNLAMYSVFRKTSCVSGLMCWEKKKKINLIQSVVGTALSDTFPQVCLCAVVNPVFMCSCLCGCIDVTLDPLLLPNPSTSLGRWPPVSLNPGELIRISGEEWTPDRVRTNCTAELHSDAFRSVFTSVCFGCMSVDLSGWQMRDWPAQAFDIRAEHPQAHTCTDKCTCRHVWILHAHTSTCTDILNTPSVRNMGRHLRCVYTRFCYLWGTFFSKTQNLWGPGVHMVTKHQFQRVSFLTSRLG